MVVVGVLGLFVAYRAVNYILRFIDNDNYY